VISGSSSVWRLGSHSLDYGRRPLVMGIVNLTPDSFFSESRSFDPAAAADRAAEMTAAGADILDLGAESSRPGSDPVSAQEEQRRLLPALELIRRATDLPITVDTYRGDTARRALDLGCDGVNDISAGLADQGMLPLAAATGCGLVLMHMRGEPGTMQDDPRYADVVAEVTGWLASRAAAAEAAGVDPERILVDPGIGFGKLLEHNLALLAGLDRVGDGRPVLVGASHKRFIGDLARADTADRLGGSLAAAGIALAAGCAVVRVHDVGPTVQHLEVLAAVRDNGTAPGDGR